MVRMSHSSDDRPQLKFTPEFYNGHPRSKQIRAICLEALEVAQTFWTTVIPASLAVS